MIVVAEHRAAQLLDAVHHALMQSDFATLERLGQALLAEIERPSQAFDPASLQVVRQKADRNARCLLAATRGIKSARRRVADIQNAANGLVTYDRSGKRAEVTAGRSLAQRL